LLFYKKHNNILNFFTLPNSNISIKYLFNFFILFNFFYIHFKYLNLFNFFNKVYIKFNYIFLLNILNSKKEYLFYYIQFKRQNGLLKKQYKFINNLHPIFFKKKNKKKIILRKSITSNRLLKKFEKFKLLKLRRDKISKGFTTVHIKKHLRKAILTNRSYYNYLTNYIFKKSKTLDKNIFIKSKQNINMNIINFHIA